uniref:Hydroxymethylglutaryl-CoA synthase n=2 Tax=Ditylum brightwellii TaxID=49249 RepID=A0A7S4SVQ3_9STRA
MTQDTYINHKIGILAIETYTSHQYVLQSELETHEHVSPGKFTIGLGQKGIALTGDREDINSICLTAVHNLLEKYDIDVTDVGRVEVGTETLVDKSKSTKTVLMDLFPNNTDIEGATIVNACYGGTAALLNAFLWCDSNAYNGKYAIVVAGDIAAYDKGPARPTGGMGAVALLIGRDAPLTIDLRQRVTHASHVWDFYKPDPSKETPVVDGVLSQVCYYQALEDVYTRFCDVMSSGDVFGLKDYGVDTAKDTYFCFHAPYNKLVQKSFGRLCFLDARRRFHSTTAADDEEDDELKPYLTKPLEETYTDKTLEKILKNKSSTMFHEKMKDANYAGQWIGNTYTGSVFFGLASLIDRLGGGDGGDLSVGKSIVMFSYGSGALASMYRLQVRETTTSKHAKFSIPKMSSTLQLTQRLESRQKVAANELDLALNTRAEMHHVGAPYTPVYPTEGRLLPGTYYLKEIDGQWRRFYERISVDADFPVVKEEDVPLAPLSVLEKN